MRSFTIASPYAALFSHGASLCSAWDESLRELQMLFKFWSVRQQRYDRLAARAHVFDHYRSRLFEELGGDLHRADLALRRAGRAGPGGRASAAVALLVGGGKARRAERVKQRFFRGGLGRIRTPGSVHRTGWLLRAAASEPLFLFLS